MIHIPDGMAVLRRRFDLNPFQKGPRGVFNEMLAARPGDLHIWTFEGKGSRYERQKILPGYKDRPSTMTDGLHALVDLTREALSHTKALQVAVPRREADDVIAHLCRTYGASQKVTVYTVDRDLLALETANVRVDVKPLKIVVDKLDPKQDRIVDPAFIHLFKSLCGDPSDRVPGLSGFGPKTFAACDWPFLQLAMERLVAGDPSPGAFVGAGVKASTAERICQPDTIAHLKACWAVTAFLPMPDDWDKHLVVGKVDQNAGEKLLCQYMH